MKKSDIEAYEEQLRKAMLFSDLIELDKLMDDDLIFVNHFGQMLTKENDMETHRSGTLHFTEINVLDQKVKLLDHAAVTVTRVRLKGTFAKEAIGGEMCYTRVWEEHSGQMKIIAGHCSSPNKNI
ncbi:MAG: nuclear transport factor 2 family protein [Sporolactobacillus sp.]